MQRNSTRVQVSDWAEALLKLQPGGSTEVRDVVRAWSTATHSLISELIADTPNAERLRTATSILRSIAVLVSNSPGDSLAAASDGRGASSGAGNAAPEDESEYAQIQRLEERVAYLEGRSPRHADAAAQAAAARAEISARVPAAPAPAPPPPAAPPPPKPASPPPAPPARLAEAPPPPTAPVQPQSVGVRSPELEAVPPPEAADEGVAAADSSTSGAMLEAAAEYVGSLLGSFWGRDAGVNSEDDFVPAVRPKAAVDAETAAAEAAAQLAAAGGAAASGSDDGTVRLWDVASGECKATLRAHTGAVLALAQMPAGRLVSGGADATLVLWKVEARAAERVCRGHAGAVRALAVVDDTRCVSGSDDCTLRVWDLLEGASQHVCAGHTRAVTAVEALSGGALFASGAADGEVRLWESSNGCCLQIVPAAHAGAVLGARSVGARLLVTAGGDGVVQLWQAGAKAGTPVRLGSMRMLVGADRTQPARQVCVYGSRLFLTGSERTLRVWSAESLKVAREVPVPAPPTALAATAGDTRVLVGNASGMISVLDGLQPGSPAGPTMLHILEGHGGAVRCIERLRDEAAAADGGLAMRIGCKLPAFA